MKVQVDITRDDFYMFNQYCMTWRVPLSEKQRNARNYVMFGYYAVCAAFIVLYIKYTTVSGNNDNMFSHIVIFPTVLYTINTLLNKINVSYFYKSYIKSMPSEAGSVLGKHGYEILDEGLRNFDDFRDGITRWEGINAIRNGNDYIYVFVDTISAYIIPKRSFSDGGECESFIEELKKRVPQKKFKNSSAI